MVKSHHGTNHIYTDFHIINFSIVISQRPNTSLIIIMNTTVENSKQHEYLKPSCFLEQLLIFEIFGQVGSAVKLMDLLECSLLGILMFSLISRKYSSAVSFVLNLFKEYLGSGVTVDTEASEAPSLSGGE